MKDLGWALCRACISYYKIMYNIIACKASSQIVGLEIEKRTNVERQMPMKRRKYNIPVKSRFGKGQAKHISKFDFEFYFYELIP